MKYALTAIALPAALVAIITSGAMNWFYWSSWGTDPLQAQILGGVSVAFDVFKSLLPSLIVGAWIARRYGFIVIGAPMFALLFIAALITATGFISTNRKAITGTLVTKTANMELAAKEADEIENRLTGYPITAPRAKIDADLEAKRQHYRWKSTKGCTDATAAKSRAFCTNYNELKGKLGAAVARERDERRLAVLRKEIKQLRAAGAGAEANPQAALLARLLPDTSKMDAEFGIVIFFGLLVELVAAFGIFLALGHWPMNRVEHAGTQLPKAGAEHMTVINPPSPPVRKARSRRVPETEQLPAPPPRKFDLTEADIIELRSWEKTA